MTKETSIYLSNMVFIRVYYRHIYRSIHYNVKRENIYTEQEGHTNSIIK